LYGFPAAPDPRDEEGPGIFSLGMKTGYHQY
jgi:hypothetical protein